MVTTILHGTDQKYQKRTMSLGHHKHLPSRLWVTRLHVLFQQHRFPYPNPLHSAIVRVQRPPLRHVRRPPRAGQPLLHKCLQGCLRFCELRQRGPNPTSSLLELYWLVHRLRSPNLLGPLYMLRVLRQCHIGPHQLMGDSKKQNVWTAI